MLDLLIVGLGWAGAYVREQGRAEGRAVAATTRDGRDDTIPFAYDASAADLVDRFKALPDAKTVLVTFPLADADAVHGFMAAWRADVTTPQWLYYGSTRAWSTSAGDVAEDATRHTPPNPQVDPGRIASEQAWMQTYGGCVVNLAGLWGGARQPRRWLEGMLASKDALAAKTGVHLIHGRDVARLTWALTARYTPGERWLATDLHSHDWWHIVAALLPADHVAAAWLQELMDATQTYVLPRPHARWRRVRSHDLWRHVGLMPSATQPGCE
ncbi:hypothetical protein CXG81DRAFT_13071 [Caulochytrium protostelioides]|uniref:Uncharacterized protein n=1 Tax=Caulochytrium protostelioides TaxID=1555241 RepID=A0A4P9WWD1_9FUNG|nr:hypothetical protein CAUPRSCDRAFT_6213 [Caulochytrium protostelioides]RKP00573.1 hypothetical protein CXG81DRAFT_13071 [Caulochytrium protostelioides]|eukprot:RKP00573.1 hypothetical protein CXG81DRAFT_13071 [Caulochytrium protostelioides]